MGGVGRSVEFDSGEHSRKRLHHEMDLSNSASPRHHPPSGVSQPGAFAPFGGPKGETNTNNAAVYHFCSVSDYRRIKAKVGTKQS